MQLKPISLDRIDGDALKVVRRLVRHGHDAFLVGGVVRDLLVGRTPKDWDITTSATPDEIRKLFRNCRIIGRRFRLAHIFFGPKIIETSTFRKHPGEEDVLPLAPEGDEVTPQAAELLIKRDNVFGTAEEDALRRDFTINGLFYDVEGDRVVDHVGGLPDLERGVVRSIGDPDVRFREDPVRILRAIRMSARLGFEIERETRAAMAAHREEIAKCAPPRVLEEFYRLLRCGASVRAFELMRETGMLRVLAPELDVGAGKENGLTESLRVVDEAVTRQETPGNATILALLGASLFEGLLDPRLKATDVQRLIEERFLPFAARLVVPRRERERARLILGAVRRMAGVGRSRRSASLAKRDYFRDALFVFQTIAPDDAGSQGARWKSLAASSPEAAAAPRKRRRRRRRGRRRPDVAGDSAVQ